MSAKRRSVAAGSRRRVARRPAPRLAEAEVQAGDYAGWWVQVRADFPARVLEDLQSKDLGRILQALEAIVQDHNLPGTDGELAATLRDVDPADGLMVVAAAAFDAIAKLPPR